jgi:hypothetical protein
MKNKVLESVREEIEKEMGPITDWKNWNNWVNYSNWRNWNNWSNHAPGPEE